MTEKWHGGKGDRPRPVDKDKYADGWERIFGNKDDINRTEANGVGAPLPPKHNNNEVLSCPTNI